MHQREKKLISYRSLLLHRLILTAALIAVFVPAVSIWAASPIKIYYNKKTVNFTGQQVAVTVDGKNINLGRTPGLELINSAKEEIYMVPAYDVFQKGLKAVYKKDGKNITISQYDTTIKMTVDSKTAYVNGTKKTLDFAPTYVKYINAGQTKLLVPARFVAENLGYKYIWKNNSSTEGTIIITNPLRLHYDDSWHTYQSTLGKVEYNGNNIDVSNMNSIIIDNTALLQANKIFSKSDIKAAYKYNTKDNSVTIAKDDTVIRMEIGSTKAYVNDTEKTLSTAPRLVINGKTNKNYVMVPGRFVAQTLGFNYIWNSQTGTSSITKANCDYFNWYVGDNFIIPEKIPASSAIGSGTDDNGISDGTGVPDGSNIYPTAEPLQTATPEPSQEAGTPSPEPTTEPAMDENTPNYILKVSGSFIDGKDIVSLETFSAMEAEITSDSTHIYITLPNTINVMENQSYAIDDVVHLETVALSSTDDTTTVITLTKKSNVKYTVQKSDSELTITVGIAPVKIAIDCGHGANTAGKRTPPMPYDLDFNNDGIIDIKKGQSIREHVANVGVGEYLAEELRRCGFEVYESAFGDEDVPLTQRQSNIKNAGSDYSVSIHFNAMGNGKTFNSTNGVGIYYYKNPESAGDSKAFAQTILNQVIKGTPQKNNGINGAHTFAMCKTSAMGTKASILIECAFMTNLHEAVNMMANADYWKETAQEIAKGICDYTGMEYIPE